MKKALIIIGSIIVLALIVSAILPSKARVERSIAIYAPVDLVFDQVNDLTKNFNWSPWLSLDPNMEVTYGEKTKGEGASYSWSGNSDVGAGTITILESNENESIVNNLDFGDMGVSTGFWTFESAHVENDNGDMVMTVNVSWAIESELSWPFWRFFGLFMEGAVGPMFEKGLATLKEVSESLPIEPKIDVMELDFEGLSFISLKDSVPIDQLGMRMGQMYGEITAYMLDNKIEMAAQPICIYHKWDMEKGFAVIEAGLPVSNDVEIGEDQDFAVNEIPPCRVAKVTHVGPYKDLNKVHFAIDEWMSDNGKSMYGPPWEIYVTDPGNEPDESKYITEVYYSFQ